MSARPDLDAIRPFVPGLLRALSADDLDRLAREGRERRRDAQLMREYRRESRRIARERLERPMTAEEVR